MATETQNQTEVKASPAAAFVSELSAMIRARYPLLYIQSYEELRCLDLLQELCSKRDSSLFQWSRSSGVARNQKAVSDIVDPMGVLKWYEDTKEKSLLVLKDFHPYLKDPGVVRKLRDLAQTLKRSQKSIILLSPVVQIPPELSKDVAVLELPLPARAEIEALVQKALLVLPESDRNAASVEGVTDAATGLTYDEIENVLAKSIVSKGTLDKALVHDEKRQIVKRSGVLDFVEIPKDMAGVGGLGNLKTWLKQRREGLGSKARDLGLPVPKGILLVGIPGCGKSLTAMTVGRQWELPLIRLDMGRVFSGVVGSSEGNVRQAIQTCEAVAPCVLWIDEIEKGLSGTQSSGASDGGTTSRVFGTLLTWMQEKRSTVFVVATANDISALPPEFLRKGRFDEIFFVDLPTRTEREEIFRIQLDRFGWDVDGLDMTELMDRTEGFSGAEIEQTIVGARYMAFGEEVAFSQKHLVDTAVDTVPLAKTMGERIEFLRSWAMHRARPATELKSSKGGDRFEARSQILEMAGLESKNAGEQEASK